MISISSDFWRQEDILNRERLNDRAYNIIGCGGIGSPTALLLSKIGVNKLTLVDYDDIERHNFPNQIYRLSDLGKKKVTALREICKDFSGIEASIIPEKFTNQKLTGVVISGVDSMASRKEIWEKIKLNPSIDLYIDGRMGAEVGKILTVVPTDPDEVAFYEATLEKSDDEIPNLPCTARAIIYNTTLIASLIANQVKKFANEEKITKEIIFDLANLIFLKGGD